MPPTDPIADLLTRMRNAQHARQLQCSAPWSKIKEQLCELMKREGYLTSVSVRGEGKDKTIEVTFSPEKDVLSLKRVSKPGRRIYQGIEELQPVLRGLGMAVVTTSQGLMTDTEAREKRIGGEVLCTVS